MIMSDFDGESGAVENVKNQHYAAMPKSWQAENNRTMNEGLGYNAMQDQANTPHPATSMQGTKQNPQLSPTSADNKYDYNGRR
jgi:hypothetical protein